MIDRDFRLVIGANQPLGGSSDVRSSRGRSPRPCRFKNHLLLPLLTFLLTLLLTLALVVPFTLQFFCAPSSQASTVQYLTLETLGGIISGSQ
jgi:hypothetical protein